MSVVAQVEELVAPLGQNSQSVFKKGHDDQETADCWQISIRSQARWSAIDQPLIPTNAFASVLFIFLMPFSFMYC